MNANMFFVPQFGFIGSRVRIDYTNHKGERALRVINPISIQFGETTWHPEPQFLLEAYDHEKNSHRTFALKDIHSWEEI